jgi:hypothetical protein
MPRADDPSRREGGMKHIEPHGPSGKYPEKQGVSALCSAVWRGGPLCVTARTEFVTNRIPAEGCVFSSLYACQHIIQQGLAVAATHMHAIVIVVINPAEVGRCDKAVHGHTSVGGFLQVLDQCVLRP